MIGLTGAARSVELLWRRTEVGRLCEWGFTAVSMGILTCIQPAPGIAPFGGAFLSGGLAAGMNPTCLAVGCLAGLVVGDGISVFALLGACAVLAGWYLCAALRARKQRGGRFMLRERPRDDGVVSALAGMGTLIAGLSPQGEAAWMSALIVGSVIASAAAAPFLRAFACVRPRRRQLMPEERIGLVLYAVAMVAGLASVALPVGVTAACLACLTAAGLGAGAGACAGLACGGALLLTGGGAGYCASLGLCGMLAGAAYGERRWTAAVILCAVMPAVSALTGGTWTDLLCALAASSAMLALPENWIRRVQGWLGGEKLPACDPDRLARRLRAESEGRLRALSEAFGELSDGYRMPVDVPDEQSLIGEMREKLCENCPNYAQCWVNGDNRAVRFLCQLISEAVDWAAGDCAQPLFGDELPPDVLRLCRRGRAIPARLGALLEDFARKRRSEMKRGAVNQLISAQFMQAQLLLGGLADAQAEPLRIRGQQASRARAALDREGIETADVMALRGQRRLEIVAVLKQGRWTPALARRAAMSLSRTFGRSYVAEAVTDDAELKFVRLPQLRATASAGCHSRRAGIPSGDSHAIRALGDDRLVLMLSDGMGSGEEAARESAQTLRLLGRFLTADVSCPLALETVNELMLARSDSDMFATVDVCQIDLAAGYAEFTKLAACRSLILRGDEVIEVEGGRLPLGILEKVQPSVTRVEIGAGDVIIMASDGVMDAVEPAALTAHLLANTHQPPGILAESILALAERSQSHRDDMTVVAARVMARRPAAALEAS